ncbi:class I SAM-dependent methyltransferase [Streptomyces luteocolor]|uniref:Methyltransferase n=1 Tax=Streptomyces luteocolor TaxID=285500 RepID=A0A125SZD3_9ACTN|nr:class I SAM-dependent methyltransferase [Streptomyces luteocolor]BAU50937.1 methyltransferase [Streptomyces luteocolor]
MPIAYAHWAGTYELFEGETARETWRLGIAAELAKLVEGPARVLDLGAGTGVGARVLGELLPQLDVTSLDRSAEMLDRGEVPKDRQVVADMAGFRAGEGYDFVVSGFDALNYLPPSDLASCLSCAADALRPGGHMVFDYSSRKVLKSDWGALEYENEKDGHTLHRRHHWESAFDRSRTVLTLRRGAETLWHETHLQYVMDPFTLEETARGHGLRTVSVRDIDGDAYSPAHTTHVYVLCKD